MTEIVQATVVETPRPERPDCYIPLYQYEDTGDLDCFGPQETPEKAFAMLADSGKLNGVVVKVPGTRAAAAGDAVDVVCKRYAGRIEWNHAKNAYVCTAWSNNNDVFVTSGPDPQSAARAALEAIRAKGGA